MPSIKKIWISPEEPYAISIEYEDASGIPFSFNTNSFPDVPTPEHPKRMVSVLGALSQEDLEALYESIGTKLENIL